MIDSQVPGPSGITAQTTAQQTVPEDYSDSDDEFPSKINVLYAKNSVQTGERDHL